MTAAEGARQAAEANPLVYLRAEQDRSLYAVLGGKYPLSERRDVLAEFRELFRLEVRQPASQEVADYEKEIQRDSAALLGRVKELAQAKELIKAVQTGVFWICGPGGIGKSYLLARLAEDLRGDPKKGLRIAWRFKAGHGQRCSRGAFFRHAIARLAEWLGRPEVAPQAETQDQLRQLQQLLDEVAKFEPVSPAKVPARVLFLVDGLDEIARLDSSFPEIPFLLARPNVVWVCAGRPEGQLQQVFAPQRSQHIFPDGLPPMASDDIRGLLLDDTGQLKYDLLKLDVETTSPLSSPSEGRNIGG